MKNFKFLIGMLLFAAILFASCDLSIKAKPLIGEKGNQETNGTAVSFDDHKPYSVRVKNESGVNLIAFKGTISNETLISGVRAHSEAGLKIDSKLFNDTCDFALQFITEEQYNANKNNLSALKNQAFSSCYAFYNKNGENNTLYRISSLLGGDAKVVCRNNTDFNIELRVDSPDGFILGYVPARNANLVLNVEANKDMVIFPVFRRYSPKKNEMYTINPTTSQGGPLAAQKVFKKGETEFRIGDLWNNATLENFTTGGCYVTLTNNNKTTGVVLMNGGKEVVTSLGVKTVNLGESETYFIPFPKAGNSQFPDSVELELAVSTFMGKSFPAGKFEFKKDHAYKFNVGGSNYEDITVSAITPFTADDKPIDVNEALFGTGE